MNIHLDNVNLHSLSGPNSFAQKLVKYATQDGHTFNPHQQADSNLCFIESGRQSSDVPFFQRLDSVYFNTNANYDLQNTNIRRTYEMVDGVIFQSQFGKKLVTNFFGEHPNSVVIHNGADVDKIAAVKPIENPILDKYENVWSCAADWRPHKRLSENIDYFLQHKGPKDCLVIAGETPNRIEAPDIFYTGKLMGDTLFALYKRSKNFIHLAWLDCCPNVVVDARAAGCHIICSDSGGSKEVAGLNATIVKDTEWDFKPMELYNPPKMSYEKTFNNFHDSEYNMKIVAQQYMNFVGSHL